MSKSDREKTIFWIPQQLLPQLRERNENMSEAIRESLTRYIAILDSAREKVADILSEAEFSLLCDVCNGTIFEAHTLNGTIWNIEDCEDSYFEKWSVNREELLKKLNGFSLAQHVALVDAIERYWRAAATGLQITPFSALKR